MVVDIGGHEAPISGASRVDPPAREDPVGKATDQQRQHHPRVILRRAGATMVDLEGAHLDPLDRLDHEVRQKIQSIGRKQKRLALAVDKFAHGEI